jgi:hypothetical protein
MANPTRLRVSSGIEGDVGMAAVIGLGEIQSWLLAGRG